jgi:hypothetical protein
MKKSGIIASLAALVSAVATLGCCLPLGFLAAIGAAGAAAYLQGLRSWLLPVAVVLLGVGFYQVRNGLRCGLRQSRIGLVLLVLATTVVFFVGLFPQVIAGVLAGLGGKPGE